MTPQPISTYLDPALGVEVKRYAPGCYAELARREQADTTRLAHLTPFELKIVQTFRQTQSMNATRNILGAGGHDQIRAALVKAGITPPRSGVRYAARSAEGEKRRREGLARGLERQAEIKAAERADRLNRLRAAFEEAPTCETIATLAQAERCNIKRLRSLLRDAGCILPDGRRTP